MKKLSFFIILLAILSFILVSCQKEQSNPVETKMPDSNPSALAKTEIHFAHYTGTEKWTIFIPCANDGMGEDVELSGPYTVRVNWFTTENGFSLIDYHDDIKLTGVGLTTGDKYQTGKFAENQV